MESPRPRSSKESKLVRKRRFTLTSTVTPNEMLMPPVLRDAVRSQRRAVSGGACPGRDTSKGQRIETASGR